jgi:ubiquinone/menaquinone biosynthesis C-methylase UbiE
MSPVDVYKAMADENRLRLIRVLVKGAFNVQELTTILDATQSNISHHLRTLQSAGIVEMQKEGTWNYYRLINAKENSVGARVVHEFLNAPHTNAEEQFPDDEAQVKKVLDSRREHARSYFESVAPHWSEIRSSCIPTESYFAELAEEIPEDKALVELGCGSGLLLARLMPRFGATIGVDYSPAMLEEARKNLKAFDVDLRLGYLEHLPLEQNAVDIALFHMVLHHLAQPELALRDTARIVRPGGKLVVCDLTPHKNETLRTHYADLWLGFNPTEFNRWVENAGFQNVSLEIKGETDQIFLLTAYKN